MMIIYLGLPLLTTSCSLPEHHNGTRRPFVLLGLAPDGVCLADAITNAAGGLLHHRFTLARAETRAIRFSVALSGRSPCPAVSRHRALWSADFPHLIHEE